MNEVKSPKKPMLYYYAMALLVLLLINFLAVPWLSQRQVKEVDYGTFMTMTENKEIGRVEVQDIFAAGKASIPPGFSAFHEPAGNSPHIWHRPQNDIPAKIQSSPARSNPDTRPGKGGGTFLLPSGPAPSKDSAPAHVPGGLKDPKAPSPFFLPKPRPHRHRIFLIPHYIKERQSPHP